ncbi:acyl-CoA dehydrogenase [Mycobacterium sp. CBMA293]|uniref:acyl-CoA dehydrogenase family protein n=2 Tax=Mycolicibacterium TaxID=1866885 RepID=UPI0012DC53A2|nr:MULTISPECIES: acyl-CoA dehydrogenase family protein [unclassified Mycolicibacterium]MUL46424.1 acyl-CoA dehydrogenase [Mycolicibacterium sp. CBMA 360]MUL57064.1 acyl-CoA dehydrogenase [Mycolicibacterium sp. CBMA 335]MUL70104.1 acyl-CoA dehydrogenase [Mycolicibacterium sp. CBMA 311]MUL92152.1 acyl-CoA dehydrogenase [Mycolicibacterium sp. CBMA 230]MUM05891.1 acyl-CoA dehydrogenase [Mycolicibacterium sp. CBMA 213]
MTMSVADRAELAAAVKDLLHEHCTETAVRRIMRADDGFDRDLWNKLAAQGVAGLIVDPEYGGVGLGAQELEAVAEVTGAALLPAPFLSSAVFATALIQAAGTDDDKARLLPGLADGTSIATVAATGARGTWSPEGVAVAARQTDSGYVLTGDAHYVLAGQIADVIIVVARSGEGIGIFEVAPGAPGFERTAATVFDATVRLSTFTFNQVPARRVGVGGWGTVEHALSLTVIALAGEQVGGTRRLFDLTVEYLKTRIQFGRPIGSFQALKHMAADLLLEVESATSAAQYAAAQFDADPAAADGAVALAGFACAEAYHTTAMQAIQMHGGIGFTWEHTAHLFLRRARTGRQLFGSSRDHRERYLATKSAGGRTK